MIYRNSKLAADQKWTLVSNPDAGAIARDFLSGELDLMRFVRSTNEVVNDLAGFLDCSSGMPLSVYRSATEELLVSATPWSESLLLTGRTADVLRAYIDSEVVKMEDRFDMTVRRAVTT